MGKQCQRCGKGGLVLYSVPHSKHKTKKRSSPNLQWTRVKIQGRLKRMRLCADCISLFRKQGKTSTESKLAPSVLSAI